MMKSSIIKGLTLVEVLVAVAIATVVLMAITIFQAGVFSNDRDFRARILANEESRLAMRRFLEESRMASPSSLGSYALATTQDNAFTFYADFDGDGSKERFRYFISGRDLVKGILKPSGSPLTYPSSGEKIIYVIHNISTTTAPIFTYYDTNDATITSPVSTYLVRSVRMSVAITPNTSKASTTIPFSIRSTFRNLKDNY